MIRNEVWRLPNLPNIETGEFVRLQFRKADGLVEYFGVCEISV